MVGPASGSTDPVEFGSYPDPKHLFDFITFGVFSFSGLKYPVSTRRPSVWAVTTTIPSPCGAVAVRYKKRYQHIQYCINAAFVTLVLYQVDMVI